MDAVFAERRKSRRLHLWVFSNEVARVEGNPGPGDVVSVHDHGTFTGNAIYSPHSLIRARIFSSDRRDLDQPLLKQRIQGALDYRRRVLPEENDFRLVYGESDMLPGLVIDKYGDHLALQVYAAGMEQRLDRIVAALRELFPVASVYARNSFRLREHEGLPQYEKPLAGAPPDSALIREQGVRFNVDVTHGQKTGFYFDQRITRRRVRALSAGRSVLDLFCYSGGFAVNAALGGATSVLAVDSSEPAIALGRRNAELNGVGERVQFNVADVSRSLRTLNSEKRKYDLIVLDPPPLAQRAKDKPKGLRAYRDLNYQAMKLLSPEGILVTCSCSHHVSWQDLLGAALQAAQGCGREFRVLERIGAGPDHPVLLSMPETEYLRCYVLQAV
jgi:23S rRNA (cytosine1962-C5)-methyltransferase